MASKKKIKRKKFYVHVQFHAFGEYVSARTEGDAKRIAFNRTMKKGYRTLIDFNNTSVNKDYF